MRAWFLIFLAVAMGGCAGYKVGPTNGVSAGSRSVTIKPFVNKTQEPHITEYLGTSLRKQLQQDGTYRLETHAVPDIIVSGEITKFLRSGLSYQPNDILTPAEYTLELHIHMVAIDVSTGKKFIDRNVQGITYIRIGQDEYSDERQAIPVLTDTLARNAVSLLVDGKW